MPIVFAAVLSYGAPFPEYRESLGRVAFVIVMVILSGVIHALLHPMKGVAANYYASRSAQWTSRLRWLWYVLGAGSPILLALAALVGYLADPLAPPARLAIGIAGLALLVPVGTFAGAWWTDIAGALLAAAVIGPNVLARRRRRADEQAGAA